MEESDDNKVVNVPRGKPKSGRLWKTVRSERYSKGVMDKPLHTSWEKKQKKRLEQKLTKELERKLKEERSQKLTDKRKRQEEHKQRKIENERKAEVVQQISNTTKLKKMRKKQLRRVEKR